LEVVDIHRVVLEVVVRHVEDDHNPCHVGDDHNPCHLVVVPHNHVADDHSRVVVDHRRVVAHVHEYRVEARSQEEARHILEAGSHVACGLVVAHTQVADAHILVAALHNLVVAPHNLMVVDDHVAVDVHGE
jgi:hypothetical protein